MRRQTHELDSWVVNMCEFIGCVDKFASAIACSHFDIDSNVSLLVEADDEGTHNTSDFITEL